MILDMIISLVVVQFCCFIYLLIKVRKVKKDLESQLDSLSTVFTLFGKEMASRQKKNQQYLLSGFKGRKLKRISRLVLLRSLRNGPLV